jgi:hypothetical protein
MAGTCSTHGETILTPWRRILLEKLIVTQDDDGRGGRVARM